MGSSFSEWGLKSKRVLSSWGLDLDLPRPPRGAVDHFLWMPAPQCVTRPLRPPRASPQPVLQLGLPDSSEDEQVVLVTGGAAEKSPSLGLGVLPGGAGPGSGSLALDFVLAKRNL